MVHKNKIFEQIRFIVLNNILRTQVFYIRCWLFQTAVLDKEMPFGIEITNDLDHDNDKCW